MLRRRQNEPGPRPRRRIDWKLMAASFGIAVGLVIVVIGLRAGITGEEAIGLPDGIESVDPVRGATQVPQQTRVFVDLVEGSDGFLTIDGVRIPTVSLADLPNPEPGVQEVEVPPGAIFEPGNATLTFTPGPSQLIERFATGEHRVSVTFWLVEEGRDSARTFSWVFYAV